MLIHQKRYPSIRVTPRTVYGPLLVMIFKNSTCQILILVIDSDSGLSKAYECIYLAWSYHFWLRYWPIFNKYCWNCQKSLFKYNIFPTLLYYNTFGAVVSIRHFLCQMSIKCSVKVWWEMVKYDKICFFAENTRHFVC